MAEKYNVSAPPNYDGSIPNATEAAQWRDEVYDSLALINVRYASTGRMVTQEVAVYPPLSLMSSMGGAMAIFMGVSVFSYLELGEMLFDYAFGWLAWNYS